MLSIMFSIVMQSAIILSVIFPKCNAERSILYCYAECYNSEFLLCRVSLLTSVVFFIVLLSVVMLIVVYAKYHVEYCLAGHHLR